MLEIKPIQSKEEQEQVALACATPYLPDAMAYGAREDGKLLGICQFRILGESAHLYDLVNTSGITDYEALILMGRAALNFINLCGIDRATCDLEGVTLHRALGFANGEVDLTQYFDSKCGGCAN